MSRIPLDGEWEQLAVCQNQSWRVAPPTGELFSDNPDAYADRKNPFRFMAP